MVTLEEQASEADAVLNGSLATRYFWYGFFGCATASVIGIAAFSAGPVSGQGIILIGALFVAGLCCFMYGANEKSDCLPRRSEQRDWLSGSSCLGEEVEGISEELIAGEED